MASGINKPTLDLTGKCAIITGGTRGIGNGIAEAFAMYGCNLAITSRNADDCASASKDLSDTYGVKCVGICADSSVKEDVDRAVAQAVEALGKIDILVNCAGIGGGRYAFTDIPEEAMDKTMLINFKGYFLFAQAVAKQMVAQGIGGRIINMSSNGGMIGSPKLAPYAASKAAVMSMTRTMANELACYGITVNSVCPGYVLTSMNAKAMSDPELRRVSEENTALKRLGTVEEIAGPVLAMASEVFRYMTGTTVVIDGGQIIGQ